MDENKFVKLLQHRRHDIMNDFQVIQGYLSMEKIDKVHAKIEEVIAFFHEERLLMQTKAPKFILFIQQMQHMQNNVQFSYQIKTGESDLGLIDEELLRKSEQFLNWLHQQKDKEELYKIELQLIRSEVNKIDWKVHIKPPVYNSLIPEQAKEEDAFVQSVHMEFNEIEMICTCEFDLKK